MGEIKTGEQILDELTDEWRPCPFEKGLKKECTGVADGMSCEECLTICKETLYDIQGNGVYVPVGEE